jgi:hypothetical protein
VRRLAQAYANLIVGHPPVPASGLNQGEISFSLVHRTVLTPNDFGSLEEVAQRLRLYEALSNSQPHPFAWQFTHAKFMELLPRLHAYEAIGSSSAAPQAPMDSDQRHLLAA